MATLDFIVASSSLASEEIGEIAATLYIKQKARFCAAVANYDDSKQKQLFDQVMSGLVIVGEPVPRPICERQR